MSESLSALWDGEYHLLEPDEHFPSDGARLVIGGWEQDEEEDVLSPFESPTMIPLLNETGDNYGPDYDKMFPLRKTEQAWGALSVQLTALSHILEVPKKQYQENSFAPKTSRWSFQSAEFLTERL